MTGAGMPSGADTVVMLEHVAVSEAGIKVTTATAPGANVRRRGEHISTGATVLALGAHLRPVDVGLATAVGASELPVFRRLRVGVLSTGDELADPPAPLSQCGGYDANRPFLLGGLAQLGFDAVDLGICADRADDFERAAHDAVRSRLDVLLTSGGAALGDADIVRMAGGVTFVPLNIRPGRGIALAVLGTAAHRTLLLGLPGNAVAAFLMFHLVARPVIMRLAGASPRRAPRLRLPLARPLTHRGSGIDYQRAHLVLNADTRLAVLPLAAQGPAMLQTITEADALIAIGPQAHYDAGDEVETLLLDC